jgi:hypothetical protein
MASNPFDQFDEGNPFDEFDAPQETKSPGLFDKIGNYGRDYFSGLQSAGAELGKESNDFPGVGTLEMLGTLATGAASPITGALKSAAFGTPYRQARQESIYQPQSQSGQAMVGGLAALTKPVGDALEFGAEKAGDVMDLVPGVDTGDAQEGGAALVDAFGLASMRPRAPSAPKVKPDQRAIPSTDELKKATDAAYTRARDAGVVVQPESFAKFVDETAAVLKKENLNDKLHAGTAASLEQLATRAKTGQPVSLEELDQLRQIVRDAPTR